MLELIILGEVPGTDFVITFFWAAVFATIVIGGAALRHTHKQRQLLQRVEIEELAL